MAKFDFGGSWRSCLGVLGGVLFGLGALLVFLATANGDESAVIVVALEHSVIRDAEEWAKSDSETDQAQTPNAEKGVDEASYREFLARLNAQTAACPLNGSVSAACFDGQCAVLVSEGNPSQRLWTYALNLVDTVESVTLGALGEESACDHAMGELREKPWSPAGRGTSANPCFVYGLRGDNSEASPDDLMGTGVTLCNGLVKRSGGVGRYGGT